MIHDGKEILEVARALPPCSSITAEFEAVSLAIASLQTTECPVVVITDCQTVADFLAGSAALSDPSGSMRRARRAFEALPQAKVRKVPGHRGFRVQNSRFRP